MLPAALYTPFFYNVMLVVVIGCSLFYLQDPRARGGVTIFNQCLMVFLGVSVLFFMGLRPISSVFIDMTNYAYDYEITQRGGMGGYNDGLFKWLMKVCAAVISAKGFFFVCACLYIIPLAIAGWRIHGNWAFPMFLSCITAFSFWAYGVNGIRNGMATSILILAFSFYELVPVMLALMAVAWGIHGSVLLPGMAFMVVWFVRKTEFWLGFWLFCVAASVVAGNVGDSLLSHYNPVSWDDRAASYIQSVGSGFRLDFLLYSIVPILLTLYFSWQPGAGIGKQARNNRLPSHGNPNLRSARAAQSRLTANQVVRRGFRNAASAGRSRANSLQQQPASLGSHDSPAKASLGASKQAVNASGKSLRMLRSDPFFVRLVNTYLMANGFWVLVINTSFSNRFAYLSWFLMPWILIYPFVPGKVITTPRTVSVAAVLLAQYSFTYIMEMVVYRLRGMP